MSTRSICACVLIAVSVMTRNLLGGTTTPTPYIAPYHHDASAAISYTFDDNLRDQFTVAFPLLQQFHIRATFFVIPGKTAATPAEAEAMKPGSWGSISWPELRELAAAGHEIASHTFTHPGLHKLPPDKAEDEIRKSYDLIKTQMGTPPLTLAYPYNAFNPQVREIALKYHLATRDFCDGFGSRTTLEKLNAWSDKLVRQRKWGVAMIHALRDGFDPLNPAIFKAHLQHVTADPELFWIDTFANVSRYVQERDHATLEVKTTATGAECLLTSTLDPQKFDIPLTIVIPAANVQDAAASRDGKSLPARLEKGQLLLDAIPSTQPIIISWSAPTPTN